MARLSNLIKQRDEDFATQGLLSATNNLSDVANSAASVSNLSSVLSDISGLTPTNGNVISGDGANWVSAPVSGGLQYSVRTTNYQASDKEGILADTSSGSFTVLLPASEIASVGDQIVVADSGGAFGTNNLTVDRNGSTIEGVAQDFVLDLNNVSVQFVYDGTTWQTFAQVGAGTYDSPAVTEDGTQTLTNKTISMGGTLSMNDQVINRPILEDYAIQGNAIGNIATTATFSMAVGNYFTATATADVDLEFTNAPPTGEFGGLVLELTNGGAYVVGYPNTVNWPAGTAPTLTAAGVDLLAFTTDDSGTSWSGLVVGLDIK